MKNLKYNLEVQKKFNIWKHRKYQENKLESNKSVNDLLWESDSDIKAVYLFLKEEYGITENGINSFNSSEDEYSDEIIQVVSPEELPFSFIQWHKGGDIRGNYTDAFVVDNDYEDLLCSYDRSEP